MPPAFAAGNDEVAVWSAMSFDRIEITRALDVAKDDVRALSPKTRRTTMRHDLTRRAVNALLHGRHAHLGGRTLGNRAKRLAEIASAYTRVELLMEPGVGTVTATEIELWLEARGCSLAETPQSGVSPMPRISIPTAARPHRGGI